MDSSLIVKLEVQEAWMGIANPDMSIEDAVTKLKELGNQIIEIDKVGRRIKVIQN